MTEKTIKKNDKMMSYEELMDLTKKKQEYIKELENRLYATPIEKESVAPKQPTIQELDFIIERQNKLISKKDAMIGALMESLSTLYQRLAEESEDATHYREKYLELKDKGEK